MYSPPERVGLLHGMVHVRRRCPYGRWRSLAPLTPWRNMFARNPNAKKSLHFDRCLSALEQLTGFSLCTDGDTSKWSEWVCVFKPTSWTRCQQQIQFWGACRILHEYSERTTLRLTVSSPHWFPGAGRLLEMLQSDSMILSCVRRQGPRWSETGVAHGEEKWNRKPQKKTRGSGGALLVLLVSSCSPYGETLLAASHSMLQLSTPLQLPQGWVAVQEEGTQKPTSGAKD